MGEKKEKRIGWVMVVVLILSALFVDLINLIPIIGGFITAMYWIAISYYLWKSGHGLFNWKIVIPELISIVIEWVPWLSFIPSVIASTIAIIFISRFEDMTGIKLIPAKTLQKMTPPRNQRIPVNATPGIRPPRLTNEN